MDDVVAALGQRVDDRRDGGDADLQAGVEGDIDLGHGGEPPVDLAVGADHLDVEPAHAAGADLLDRVRDPVHRADAIDDQRHPRAIAVAAGQLGLLAPQERRRGGVRDRRQAGVEQGERAFGRVGWLVLQARDGFADDAWRACAREHGARGGRGRRG